MAEVWCVWALLPNRKGPDGFSMVLTGMTRAEAERAVECSTFRARAMPAAESASYRPAALESPPVGTRGELNEDMDLIAQFRQVGLSVEKVEPKTTTITMGAVTGSDPERASAPSGILRRPAKSIRLDS
jgi:hypothetical protein